MLDPESNELAERGGVQGFLGGRPCHDRHKEIFVSLMTWIGQRSGPDPPYYNTERIIAIT